MNLDFIIAIIAFVVSICTIILLHVFNRILHVANVNKRILLTILLILLTIIYFVGNYISERKYLKISVLSFSIFMVINSLIYIIGKWKKINDENIIAASFATAMLFIIILQICILNI